MQRQLKFIVRELLEQVRKNATVDCHIRGAARARMQILVKRILKKYGYPPDLSYEAVQTVLEQAEVLLREVAVESVSQASEEYDFRICSILTRQ